MLEEQTVVNSRKMKSTTSEPNEREVSFNRQFLFDQAMRQTRMAMCVTSPREPDNPIVFANDAFFSLTGYDSHEVIGRNCRFLQGPETDPDAVAEIRRAIAAEDVTHLEFLNYRKDGSAFWNALHIGPIYDESGELLFYFGSQWNATERFQAKQEVREAYAKLEERVRERTRELEGANEQLRLLQSAIDGAKDAVLITEYAPLSEPGPKIIYASRGFERMTGYKAEEVLGKTPRLLQGPETHREELDGLRRRLEAGEAANACAINYKKDGTPFWVEWTIEAVAAGDHGQATHWVSVQRDVTERRAAEEERELLLRELNHRVKNLFALISAIIALSGRGETDAQQVTRKIRDRVMALARAHQTTVERSGKVVADFGQLARLVLEPYETQGGGIRFTGPTAQLTQDQIAAMGLILHELATNAAKYGGLSSPERGIELRWRMEDAKDREGGAAILVVEWDEVVSDAVEAPEHDGFGRRMILQAASQMNAEVETEWSSRRLLLTLRLPVAIT